MTDGERFYENRTAVRLRVASSRQRFVVSPFLRGLRGSVMRRYSNAIDPNDGVARIDRDELALPPALVENAVADPSVFLRPALDVRWQAFGQARVPEEFLTEPAGR